MRIHGRVEALLWEQQDHTRGIVTLLSILGTLPQSFGCGPPLVRSASIEVRDTVSHCTSARQPVRTVLVGPESS